MSPAIAWLADELVVAAQHITEPPHQATGLGAPASIAEEVQHHPVEDPVEGVVVDGVHHEVRKSLRRARVGEELVRDLRDRACVPLTAPPGWREPVPDRDSAYDPVEPLRTLLSEVSLRE